MRRGLIRLWTASAHHRVAIGVALLVACLAVFVWRQWDEIGDSISAIANADPGWITAALLVQTLAIALLSASYVAVMRILRHPLGWWRLTRLHLRRMAVATVTPAGSATSIYVFVKSVESDDVPARDALLTIALRGACGYAAFVLLLPAAIVLRHQSMAIQLAALALAVLLVLLVFAIRSLLGGERMPDWFARRMPIRAVAFIDQARRHDIHLAGLAAPLFFSLASKLASVGVMYLSLLAVGADATVATALVGYVVANLSQAVSPVFGGFGVVELTMALVLEQLGVPTSEALAATLIFRLCDLWYQLGLGLLVQMDARAVLRRVTTG